MYTYRDYVSPNIIKLEMDVNDKIQDDDARFKTVIGGSTRTAGVPPTRGSLTKLAAVIFESQPAVLNVQKGSPSSSTQVVSSLVKIEDSSISM